jgi:hypothetical protein
MSIQEVINAIVSRKNKYFDIELKSKGPKFTETKCK